MTKNCSLGEQSIIHKISDRDILSRFTPMLMDFLIMYKTMSNAQPIINSLRELNSKLLAEIAEPRKGNAKILEFRKENTKLRS